MKKSIFSKIITPILHKFQPLHGVTTWLPTFAVPQKGWSNTSFITSESFIAVVYSEPYENLILKRIQTEILRYLRPTYHKRCRKLSDTEVVRHGSCPTKPNLTILEFVGELPCRTNSAFRTIRPNVFLAFRIPWFSIPFLFQIDFSYGSE